MTGKKLDSVTYPPVIAPIYLARGVSTNMKNCSQCVMLLVMLLASIGCSATRTSNTARTATEQVLLSAAIDRSLNNVSFEPLRSQKVFIDDKYLDSVDKGYLMGTLRHRALAAGAVLAPSAAEADVVIEARSGGIGTDTEESFIGIPSVGVPGMAISIPDIKLVQRNTQHGTAKIGLVAYDPKTGAALGLGGQSTALTKNDDMYVLGVGPIRSGEVRQEREAAVGYQSPARTFMPMGSKQSDSLAKKTPLALVDDSMVRMADLPPTAESSSSGVSR
jgi:hypothetical protein